MLQRKEKILEKSKTLFHSQKTYFISNLESWRIKKEETEFRRKSCMQSYIHFKLETCVVCSKKYFASSHKKLGKDRGTKHSKEFPFHQFLTFETYCILCMECLLRLVETGSTSFCSWYWWFVCLILFFNLNIFIVH